MRERQFIGHANYIFEAKITHVYGLGRVSRQHRGFLGVSIEVTGRLHTQLTPSLNAAQVLAA